MIEREAPYPDIDESTAVIERREATRKVVAAEVGEIRTRSALSRLAQLRGEIMDMHNENHYVERLLPVFRGGHSA